MRQRLRFVELPRDDQVGVVRLVVLLVERGQVGDRHPFDIGAVADHRLAIVVEVVGGSQNAFVQHVQRAVFAGFHFVPDHRHFGVQILLAAWSC